jgi:murein L,D-transpeptidase YcbB/YkuD
LAVLGLPGAGHSVEVPAVGFVQNIQAEIEPWMQSPAGQGVECRVGEALYAFPLLSKFYEERAFAPVWFSENGLSAQALAFVQVLAQARSEGLRPEDYHSEKLTVLLKPLQAMHPPLDRQTAALAADAELLLSDAFFTYGTHLAVGRTPLEARDGVFDDPRLSNQLEEQLCQALAQGRVFEFLKTWTRQDALTLGLKSALQYYRDLDDRGDWLEIPAGPELHPGEQDPFRIPEVRRKLRALGDLPPGSGSTSEDFFDPALETALKRYQRRYALKPTGILDEPTLACLNRPLESTIRQLELSLERQRWLPRDLGRRYVLVNIPDFLLRVRAGDSTVLRMRVVVGKQYRSTPVFASKITTVVLDPAWTIPTEIILKEKLAQIVEDPGRFFSRNHISVIRGWGVETEAVDPASVNWRRVKKSDYYEFYRFRQEPGPWNSLGRIKFVMPNAYDVYLHDTPDRGLFDAPVRDFSHGCIRVENPLALAAALMGDPRHWPQERFARALGKKHEQTIDLPTPVPVYINYLTAFIGDDGLVYFFPDIYDRDRELASVWEEPLLNPCQPIASTLP